MSKTYRIKPLVWEKLVGARASHIATVIGGHYEIRRPDREGCITVVGLGAAEWRAGPFITLESAKLAAEQHWHDRMAAALEEVGDE